MLGTWLHSFAGAASALDWPEMVKFAIPSSLTSYEFEQYYFSLDTDYMWQILPHPRSLKLEPVSSAELPSLTVIGANLETLHLSGLIWAWDLNWLNTVPPQLPVLRHLRCPLPRVIQDDLWMQQCPSLLELEVDIYAHQLRGLTGRHPGLYFLEDCLSDGKFPLLRKLQFNAARSPLQSSNGRKDLDWAGEGARIREELRVPQTVQLTVFPELPADDDENISFRY
jgi:hypothetical protein